jgi:hypothetical protein
MTMAQDGGKVVSLTHRPPLPPPPQEMLLVLISIRTLVVLPLISIADCDRRNVKRNVQNKAETKIKLKLYFGLARFEFWPG